MGEKFYRFTTEGEGVFSAGKRLLPDHLIEAATQARSWIPRPELPEGDYVFFFSEQGKKRYLETLYKVHQQYLKDITPHEFTRSELEAIGEAIYEDDLVIGIQKS